MAPDTPDPAFTPPSDDWGDDAATFGDRLVLAREATGLTQTQLAHRMGVKLQTLRNWEENRAEPRANRLQMLAGMLNVSMVWLMSGRGEPPSTDAPADVGGLETCLSELRFVRIAQRQLVERLARLEKRLRARGA